MLKKRDPVMAKKYILITSIILSVFFILSWITPFCNLYANTVYGIISDALGFITGIIPVNLGECLMYILALCTFTAAILSLLLIFLRKKPGFKSFTVRYLKILACTAMTFLLLYMFNWWLPFRSGLMGGVLDPSNDYSFEELETLRNYFAEKTNELSEEVLRDGDGKLIYTEKEEVCRQINESMKGLSGEFSRLSGYYPPVKEAYCSDVLRWMYIGGFTYPYTMELTMSSYVSRLYYPALYAHEASHHQGYYRENEANFFEYLGCNGCEDPFIRYSAHIEMYYYLDESYREALSEEFPGHEEEHYKEQVQLSSLISKDEKAARADVEALYKQKSHPLQNLSEKAAKIADTGWKTQGKLIGEEGYGGVVNLLLEYYRKNPESFHLP